MVDVDAADGPVCLHVHLGLFGRFRRRPVPPPDPRGALRLRLVGDERTWDLSGPTACELVDPDQLEALLDRLGPDPLRADADGGRFVERAGRSRRPIGSLLMDQAVVAGIGNVYRAELLFRAGIDPRVPGRSLSADELGGLWDDAVALLRIGERLGRIVTTDPAEVRPDLARPTPGKLAADDRLYVYRRESCRRCDAPIERFEIEGRRAYACPVDQRR